MSSEQWKRVRRLFDEAVSLAPDARERFLGRVLSEDPRVHAELSSLLARDGPSDGRIRAAVNDSAKMTDRPALSSGDRLGEYEICSVIGVGGMGEVYRAHDTVLERDVAIKVIPDSFATDPVRLERLQREAKALASLNHPNIASIHGLVATSAAPALVLELVAGETLSERLARAPLRIADALPIAAQIADALDAAHERGIIHRDLKPANIMITPDGLVKVLDLGLAKTAGDDESERVETERPVTTVSSPMLGTVAYMSPEQARGEPVDKRTDIWAFGAVLYEILTGQKLFGRSDLSESVSAVLAEPIALDALPPETPPAVATLVRRCVERDRKKRLRDIGDAKLDLDAASRPDEPREPSSPRSWVVGAAAIAAIVAASIAWLAFPRIPADDAAIDRFSIAPPLAVDIVRPSNYEPAAPVAIAPDGRRIAFAGTRNGESRIYVRSFDVLEARPLEGSEGGHSPFFSPDGRWVGFLTGSSGEGSEALKKASIGGGPPKLIADGHFDGGSWGPDDTIVLGSRIGLLRVSANGGTPTPLLSPPAHEPQRAPHYLPGGGAVLFYTWTGSPDTFHVDVVSLETGVRQALVAGSSPRFASSGHLVFARDGALWAASFDPRRLRLTSEPIRAVERIATNIGGVAGYDLAADGSLVYLPDTNDATMHVLTWVDYDGIETGIDASPRGYRYPRVSPDGTRVAFGLGHANPDVWLLDLTRSVTSRFTTHASADSDAVWSPDGTRLAFHSHRDGEGNVYWRDADGAGKAHRLTRGAGEKMATGWTPDGTSLLYWARSAGTEYDLFLVSAGGTEESIGLLRTAANEASGAVSPDGRWLAYVSDESGRTEVYLRVFADVTEGKWQISSGGGRAPVWGRDSKILYYRRGREMRRVRLGDGPPLVAGKPETIFEGDYVHGGLWERNYDISPGQERFLMLKEVFSEEQDHVVLVRHWASELDRLVRADP